MVPRLWLICGKVSRRTKGTQIMFHRMMTEKNRFLVRKYAMRKAQGKQRQYWYSMAIQWLGCTHGSFQRVKTLCVPCGSENRATLIREIHLKNTFPDNYILQNTGSRNYFGTVIILMSFPLKLQLKHLPWQSSITTKNVHIGNFQILAIKNKML